MEKLKVNKKLIIQKIDKGLVCFDTDKAFLYTFNEVGEYIFNKVKLGWEVERIITSLSKKYNVELPILKKDVISIIKEMKKAKLFVSPSRIKNQKNSAVKK